MRSYTHTAYTDNERWQLLLLNQTTSGLQQSRLISRIV